MKRFARVFVRFTDLASRTNLFTSLKVVVLETVDWSRPVKVRLDSEAIQIRLKSPDLSVATTSLGSEFSPLSNVLPHDFDGLIIDAGGYIGTAAIKFSKMYPLAKVVTIEPSTENFALLLENTRKFKNISAINAALVASNRSSLNLLDRGTGAWGYTVIEKPLDNVNAETLQTVRAVTLSDIIELHNNAEVGILKLDIEGSERDIFIENGAVLNKIFCIFVELHDRIVEGCTLSFEDFSKNRLTTRFEGEKYLSMRKT